MQHAGELVGHESEAGEIEIAGPADLPMARGVADRQTDCHHPENEVGDIAQLAGEEANRLEQDRHCRNEDNRRGRQEQILLEKNERLNWRFATHD